MNSESDIKNIIKKFHPVTLDQMDSVKLMKRTDTKFVFNIKQLPEILHFASNDYLILEINEIREQKYETTYFDTEGYTMYTSHHNGKLNRHKIRIRKYVSSDQEFLEVKKKNNRAETIKNRIQHSYTEQLDSSDMGNKFLEKYTPFDPQHLKPKLGNSFIRLTLVSKQFNERITIDYNLNFKDLTHNKGISAKSVCIAEIKRNKDQKESPFLDKLNQMKIQSSGFSKYCFGIAMLSPDVKTNLFKQKMKKLEKIITI